MQRKPIILILTSKDEICGESASLKEQIQKLGSHNVVILDDTQYGSVKKLSRLDRLVDARGEHQSVLGKRDRGILHEKLKMKHLSKRANRIGNAIKRFQPHFILALTPFAHHSCSEAKKVVGFSVPILYYMPTFTVEKRNFGDNTSIFLVENSDIKADLIKLGIRSKDIITLGLPFELKKNSAKEIAAAKQEFGLSRTKTVFVNVSDKKAQVEILSLLFDQGDIINIIAYVGDGRDVSQFRSLASNQENTTIIFINKLEVFDAYLSISDIVVTDYDISTLYKCFMTGIPAITFGKGEQVVKDINFLLANGLILQAKDNIDIVAELYKLIQTDASTLISQAGLKWVEMSNLDNIANFLISF